MGLYFDVDIENFKEDAGHPLSTINRYLELMREESTNRRNRRGGKGRGNDIYELPENTQFLFYFFNFTTCEKTVWLAEIGKATEAPRNKETFNPSVVLAYFGDPPPGTKETNTVMTIQIVPPEVSLHVSNGKLYDRSGFKNQALELPANPNPDPGPGIRPPLRVVPDSKPSRVAKRKKGFNRTLARK